VQEEKPFNISQHQRDKPTILSSEALDKTSENHHRTFDFPETGNFLKGEKHIKDI